MHCARALLAVLLIGLFIPVAAGAPPAPEGPRTFAIGTDYIEVAGRFPGDTDTVATLLDVDPSTNRPFGRSLRLNDLSRDEPLISPDRRVIALGSSYNGRITRVDPVAWRRLAPFQVGERWNAEDGSTGDRVDLLSWPGLLIATTGRWEGKYPEERSVIVVDPAGGRVTAREPLGGWQEQEAVAPDGGVLILSVPDRPRRRAAADRRRPGGGDPLRDARPAPGGLDAGRQGRARDGGGLRGRPRVRRGA